MQKKDLEKLLESHVQTNDKEFIEQYKQNPPQVIENLQWQPNEGIISYLSREDLIQLLSRYLNNDAVYTKNILHLLLRTEKLLTFIANKIGVDVDKEFKADAKKQAERIEENIEKSKQALKDSVK